MVAVGIVLLPQERWPQARRALAAGRGVGFDHAWTYDHLAWRTLADEPWFATVPLLAAAAAVTERIRLGTWVAGPNFRHPVPFAKDVMGLDDVSGGRLLLGLGAGGAGWDAGVLGPPPTPRRAHAAVRGVRRAARHPADAGRSTETRASSTRPTRPG